MKCQSTIVTELRLSDERTVPITLRPMPVGWYAPVTIDGMDAKAWLSEHPDVYGETTD